MNYQKKVVAIHDISCTGRCSLTVALPILSAAGFDTAILPTAVLSTHTGGFENFTYRDLTDDILPIAKHWQSLNLEFDAIYTGFLGSYDQIDLIKQFIQQFGSSKNTIIIDPVMADNGQLYKIYSEKMISGMIELCKNADIIIPNITEATFMVNEQYLESGYTEKYIENLLHKLSNIGPKKIILTGVSFDENSIGVASYDKDADQVNYYFNKKIDGYFHGTGDIFGSTFVSSFLSGLDLLQSASLAVDFVKLCIEKSVNMQLEKRYGVCFELELPFLIQKLNKNLI